MELATSWGAQAIADAAAVLSRARSVLSFQIATALQTSLYRFMSASEQLGALLLVCVGLEGIARVSKMQDIRFVLPRSVLVVQVGQALQELLVFKEWASSSAEGVAQGFLLNTLGLCVPAILEMLSPIFFQSAYLQNALSVWLFQYVSSTRQLLEQVDFGVSPVFLCLTVFSLRRRARGQLNIARSTELYKYVTRALHMLLVDWMLRTLADTTLLLPRLVQIALWSMLIVFVDLLGLDVLSLMQDLRGFTVFRIAAELQRIGVLSSDTASAAGAAIIVFCVHSSLGVLQLQSRATAGFAEVLFVACTNVILQTASFGTDAAQVTLICIICVLLYEFQAALAGWQGAS